MSGVAIGARVRGSSQGIQYLTLFAELAILTTKTAQLLAPGPRHAVLATAFIATRLADPAAERGRRALEVPSELSGRAARPVGVAGAGGTEEAG